MAIRIFCSRIDENWSVEIITRQESKLIKLMRELTIVFRHRSIFEGKFYRDNSDISFINYLFHQRHLEEKSQEMYV